MTILRAQKPDGTFGEVQMDADGNLLVNDGGRRSRVVSARGAGCGYKAFVNTGSEVPDTDNYMGVLFYNMPIAATCSDLRIVYGNCVGDTANIDPITIRASVELDGALYPIYFRGKRETVLEGSVVESDPLSLTVAAGTDVKVRTYYNVGAAGKQLPMTDLYLHGYDMACFADSETRQDANNWKDALLTVLDSPDFTSWGDYSGDSRSFAPIAILGDVDADRKSVAILGDSIAAGGGDNGGAANGFIARALREAELPYVNVALTGEESGTLVVDPRRLRLMNNCTHAIVAYGRNDITNNRGLQTIKNRLLELWTALSDRGLKVYACTVTPKVDTDATNQAFLSVEGQTLAGNSHVDVLDALNAWILTCPSPLSGVFDTAAEVSAKNLQGQTVWKAWDNPVVSLDYHDGQFGGGATLASVANVTGFAHSGLGIVLDPLPLPWPWHSVVKFNAGDFHLLNWQGYYSGEYSLALSEDVSIPATGEVHIYDNFTLDGLHPTTSAHIAMSRAVAVERLD
jgi:lysophospholipase L1-like esterase